ncbi:MAG: DUF4920 domain-containing protein [Candidatus Eisenbacteria bacterium]|nr:DUF4920 domain-containing protein [Candidatus Eisenbacteria bacterium]
MRKPLTILAALSLAAVLALPAFAGDAAPAPQRFGAAVTVQKPTNIQKLAKSPAKFQGQTIRIEGTVKEVCQGAGCWVEVVDAKGASFIARSLDESVLLPKDCKGQRVVVQGLLTTMPKKDHDHTAAEAGHSCPSPAFVLSTSGIELAPVAAAAAK